jgi:endonuclease/exonuclease/phosphatase family metal-dependent hydrolase
MDYSFRVCSYNLGTDDRDYNLLWSYLGKKERDNSAEYAQAEKKVADLLKEEADVYLFQEFDKSIADPQGGPPAHTTDRPLIQALLDKKFVFIQHRTKTQSSEILLETDAVIFLNPNRFEVERTQTYSINRTTAVAIATDRVTKQRIAFVSFHAAGFNLTQTPEKLQQEVKDGNGPAWGDEECQTLVDKLQELESKSDVQILGGDVNASPEKWQNRFNIFTQQNIQVIRTNEPTAVNPKDSTYQEREIDYFFINKSNVGKAVSWIQSLFSRVIVDYQVTISKIAGFEEWSTENNASDHKPIRMKVTPMFQETCFSRLIDRISHCLSYLSSFIR